MKYENENDLMNEENVIKKIAKGSPYKKLGEYDIDYEIIGKAFIEIKCYNKRYLDYDNLIISIQKLVKLQQKSRILPTYLFIQYIDCIKFIEVNDIEGYIRRGGRKPREFSTNDIELLLYLPTAKLNTFYDEKM